MLTECGSDATVPFPNDFRTPRIKPDETNASANFPLSFFRRALALCEQLSKRAARQDGEAAIEAFDRLDQ